VRYYTIVRFVDVGGIDDHHCLNNLFTDERGLLLGFFIFFYIFFIDVGGIDDYHCLSFLFII
jgi:hypothetical protein